LARGESPAFESVFGGFKRWPSVTGAILLCGLVAIVIVTPAMVITITAVGIQALRHADPSTLRPAMLASFFAAAVPSEAVLCWWACRMWPVAFVVMEPEYAGAVDALRRSWTMTRGNAWRAAGMMALALPLELAGLIALCVGIVPALIVFYYGCAHGYEMLRPRPAAAASPAPVFVP
jgi:uncharacterized membrane protein